MHDGGRKKEIHYFTLCKASRISTFDEVLHDVSSFHNRKTKQNKTKQNKPLRLCRTDWKSTFKSVDLLRLHRHNFPKSV